MVGSQTILRNNIANSELPIQNSNRTAGTSWVSAITDFNAHKRLPLPDLRGRVLVGADNLGGSLANIVTATEADTLGKKAGEEKHTQTINEMPNHNQYFCGSDTPNGVGPYNGEATD